MHRISMPVSLSEQMMGVENPQVLRGEAVYVDDTTPWPTLSFLSDEGFLYCDVPLDRFEKFHSYHPKEFWKNPQEKPVVVDPPTKYGHLYSKNRQQMDTVFISKGLVWYESDIFLFLCSGRGGPVRDAGHLYLWPVHKLAFVGGSFPPTGRATPLPDWKRNRVQV